MGLEQQKTPTKTQLGMIVVSMSVILGVKWCSGENSQVFISHNQQAPTQPLHCLQQNHCIWAYSKCILFVF